MQARLFDPDQPLPNRLREDIAVLLAAEGGGVRTWVRAETGEASGERYFTLRKTCNAGRAALRLEFWIPDWMSARGAAAILPAHLAVEECLPGERAVVPLGERPEAEWQPEAPRLGRTCARLMNELWGRTDAPEVVTVEA